MQNKKLSIITVNFNNYKGLRKTIESVISQTFIDYEYIIIDGGSSDESVDIIKQYEDKINYWISEPDKGIYNAMNKGIIVSKGDYIQFLNSGDLLISKSILHDVFALNRNEDILYGFDILCNNDGTKELNIYPSKLTFYQFYVGSLSHQGSFHKRSLFDILYNEGLSIAADWEFYIRKIIFENCSTFPLSFPIIYFDMNGISQNPNYKQIQNSERLKILNSFMPEKVLKDYEVLFELKQLKENSLYPYIELFLAFPKLQRLVKRFMKFALIVSGNKRLLPK